jgi:hypothetical protein
MRICYKAVIFSGDEIRVGIVFKHNVYIYVYISRRASIVK